MRFGQTGAILGFCALTLGACGGTTRHGPDASDAPGTVASGGTGAEPAIPTLQGVPIGDCRVPTDATRRAGCPAEPPQDSTPCEAPDGLKQCPYDLQVSEGRAMQLVYTCHPNQLTWAALNVPCGLVCATLSVDVIELETNCSNRQAVSCKNSDSAYAFETDQQWLDDVFGRLLTKCMGDSRYNRQVQLELADGCATRLSSNAAFPPEAITCLKAELNSARWQCGLLLSCTSFASYFL